MTAPQHILCVGRIYCDLLFRSDTLPRWGHEVFAEDFTSSAGGGAFITAAYLSAFGHRISLAGNAGAEFPFGPVIARDMQACDIDGQQIRPGTSAQVTVALAGGHDRAFLTYRDPALITAPDVTGCDHLHIGELSSLAECPALIEQARAAGATVSCDCGDGGGYPADVTGLIAGLDLFMPSQSEWQALRDSGLMPDLAPGALVVKMGEQGARTWDGTDWITTPALPATPKDPTGAGDAFNAGYLHRWLAGAAPLDCLQLGARCGAATVEMLGGWSGRDRVAAFKD